MFTTAATASGLRDAESTRHYFAASAGASPATASSA